MFYDEPEIFRYVVEIPSIFTINSFNFTQPETDMQDCECIEGESDIRKRFGFRNPNYDFSSLKCLKASQVAWTTKDAEFNFRGSPWGNSLDPTVFCTVKVDFRPLWPENGQLVG